MKNENWKIKKLIQGHKTFKKQLKSLGQHFAPMLEAGVSYIAQTHLSTSGVFYWSYWVLLGSIGWHLTIADSPKMITG